MNKLVTSSIAIALFLLAGCAASGPKLASSAEDIAGTWHSTTDSGVLQFNEDGTALGDPAAVNPNPAEFRFEGTRYFVTNTGQGNACTQLGADTGIYEVELLENGNLKFTVIEDECAIRVSVLSGALIEREWEPVP